MSDNTAPDDLQQQGRPTPGPRQPCRQRTRRSSGGIGRSDPSASVSDGIAQYRKTEGSWRTSSWRTQTPRRRRAPPVAFNTRPAEVASDDDAKVVDAAASRDAVNNRTSAPTTTTSTSSSKRRATRRRLGVWVLQEEVRQLPSVLRYCAMPSERMRLDRSSRYLRGAPCPLRQGWRGPGVGRPCCCKIVGCRVIGHLARVPFLASRRGQPALYVF